jgi:hypothetical protein
MGRGIFPGYHIMAGFGTGLGAERRKRSKTRYSDELSHMLDVVLRGSHP